MDEDIPLHKVVEIVRGDRRQNVQTRLCIQPALPPDRTQPRIQRWIIYSTSLGQCRRLP